MPDEELDDKIEEVIERKIEEKLQQEAEDEESEGILDRKIEQKIQELAEEPGENGVDRRSFLKMLGLGAGGLALASPAAAWFSVNDSTGGGTQTLSDVLSEGNDISGTDIVDGGTTVWDTSAGHVPSGVVQSSGLDADTVDGKEASELDSQIQRDSQGSALISRTLTVGQNVTVTPNTGSNSTTMFDRKNYDLTSSSQTMTHQVTINGNKYFQGTLTGSRQTGNGTLYIKLLDGNNNTLAQAQTAGTNQKTTSVNSVSVDTSTLKGYQKFHYTGGGTTTTPTFYGSLSGYYNSPSTGTNLNTSQLTSSVSPAWVSYTAGVPTSGTWNKTLRINGSTVPTSDYLYGHVTTGVSFTTSVSWSNVSTTTTFTQGWKVKEGYYTS